VSVTSCFLLSFFFSGLLGSTLFSPKMSLLGNLAARFGISTVSPKSMGLGAIVLSEVGLMSWTSTNLSLFGSCSF